MIEYWTNDGKYNTLTTNNFNLKERKIMGICDNQWLTELPSKQPKRYFPLMCFYNESADAIESQRWVCPIANLLLTVVNRFYIKGKLSV